MFTSGDRTIHDLDILYCPIRIPILRPINTSSSSPSSGPNPNYSLSICSASIASRHLRCVRHLSELISSRLRLGFFVTMLEQGTSSIPSSSEPSSSSALQIEVKEGLESDDEIMKVPELPSGASAASTSKGTAAASEGQGQKKRARSAADKENKRLKRLLRNRVSAQQARERKKAYLNDLEVRLKELERKNSELEEKLSTLQNENQMLRQILKNTTAGRRGSGGGKADGSV